MNGHPVHRLLAASTLGLLATSVVLDLIDLVTGTGAFNLAAWWMLAGGITVGLLSSPWVMADWLRVPRGSRARRIGAMHGSGHAMVILLFAASWWLRTPEAEVPGLAIALSLAGAGTALVTAWLRGAPLSPRGASVYDDAGLGAPGS